MLSLNRTGPSYHSVELEFLLDPVGDHLRFFHLLLESLVALLVVREHLERHLFPFEVPSEFGVLHCHFDLELPQQGGLLNSPRKQFRHTFADLSLLSRELPFFIRTRALSQLLKWHVALGQLFGRWLWIRMGVTLDRSDQARLVPLFDLDEPPGDVVGRLGLIGASLMERDDGSFGGEGRPHHLSAFEIDFFKKGLNDPTGVFLALAKALLRESDALGECSAAGVPLGGMFRADESAHFIAFMDEGHKIGGVGLGESWESLVIEDAADVEAAAGAHVEGLDIIEGHNFIRLQSGNSVGMARKVQVSWVKGFDIYNSYCSIGWASGNRP